MPLFEWDEANTVHISRHQITREEVEQVIDNSPLELARNARRLLGLLQGGRWLVVVYTTRKGRVRPITAFPVKKRKRKEVMVSMATAKRKRVAERLKTPHFKSEAEEARWYEANQDLLTDLLIRHGRKSPIKTKSVTIRLPEQDIKLAQEMAEEKGVGYQTFIKTVLHGSLKELAARRG